VLEDVQHAGPHTVGHCLGAPGLPCTAHLTVHEAWQPHFATEVLAGVLLSEIVSTWAYLLYHIYSQLSGVTPTPPRICLAIAMTSFDITNISKDPSKPDSR
jgi:hypothetical protein